MLNDPNCFNYSPKGYYQVNSKLVYKNLYPEIVKKLQQDLPVSYIVDWIRQETEKACYLITSTKPTTGALNNSIGRWNEYIAISWLCEIAIDIYQKCGKCLVVFSLGISNLPLQENEGIYSKFLNLFASEEFLTSNALESIYNIKKNIFFSSPDYVIAVIDNHNIILKVQELMSQQCQDPGDLSLYNLLKGKLKAKEIKAVISLKTSNRSDRRYQPSFEASVIKAISYAARQDWKYYMVTNELTRADKRLFELAIAPHSIAIGQSNRLIDGVFIYQNKQDLIDIVNSVVFH